MYIMDCPSPHPTLQSQSKDLHTDVHQDNDVGDVINYSYKDHLVSLKAIINPEVNIIVKCLVLAWEEDSRFHHCTPVKAM